MIEAQKKAMEEKMAAAKVTGAQNREAAAARAQEEAKTAVEAVEAKNVAEIAVEDNFDIDDIWKTRWSSTYDIIPYLVFNNINTLYYFYPNI